MTDVLSDEDFFGASPAGAAPTLLSDDDFFGTAPSGTIGVPLPAANEDRSVPFGSFRRGWNRLQQATNVLANDVGLLSNEGAAEAIARDEADIKNYPVPPDVQAGLEEIQGAEGWGDAALAIITNPKAVLSVIGESVPLAAAPLVSAGVGAAAGSVVPLVGTTAGYIGGSAAGSFATEYSATMLDVLRDQGVDLTDAKAVEAALADPEIMDEARARGLKRGIPIAVFDAISFGIGGKIAALGARGGSVIARTGAQAGEVAAQVGLGAGGEAAAQLVDKGEITSPGDVLLEGAAESVTGVPEIVVGEARNAVGARVPADASRPELPQGAASAETLLGADPAAARITQPAPPVMEAPRAAPAAVADPAAPVAAPAVDTERLTSPRLTEADRASPLPNNLIDDGKAIIEQALTAKPISSPATATALGEMPSTTSGLLSDDQVFAAPTTAARGTMQRRDISTDTAVTSAGRSVPVTYAVVEASSLIPSQRDEGGANPAYPGELQPRDRERGVSQTQINTIAQRLNPRLLDKSPRASDGAPIVSDDGVVESGNGRVLALRRAYAQDLPTAQGYRTYLADQGYPVEGMQQPVLVRVRSGEMAPADRQAFTREANERDTLGMAATERAMADASAIPASVLSLYRGGDVDVAANREFVRGFMRAVVNPNDQAGMVDASGAVSQDAIRRVQAALLAKAYGDGDLVAALVESADVNIKSIGGALMDVAADWAQMRDEAQAGSISPDVDQTARLLEAVRLVQRARREGRPVAEYVGQTDIFSGSTIHRISEAFLRLMFRNDRQWISPVSRDKLADALRFYVTEARKTSAGIDLLGEQAPGAEPILKIARERQYGSERETQGGLELGQRAAEPARESVRPPGEGRAVDDAPPAEGGSGGQVAGSREDVAPTAKPPRINDGPAPTASWVIRDKATGEVVMETFDRAKVDALNTAKYEAVPIQEYLGNLNKPALKGAEPAPDVREQAAEPVDTSKAAAPPASYRLRERTGSVEAEFILTPGFRQQAEMVADDLRAALDGLGLKDVAVRVSERINAIVGGVALPAGGRYLNRVIDVALKAGDQENQSRSTLDHEIIHAMRDLGLFGQAEMAILERKAKKEWIDQYGIDELYAGFPEWARTEEGIAHAYEAWAGGAKFDGLLVKSFRKIKAFIEALGNVLRGLGFTSADDIFERIASGEVGSRPRAGDRRGAGAFSIGREDMFPAETVDTVDGPREQLVIPGAERVPEKVLAERKAAEPMRGKKPQRDTSALPLFSDDRDQMALFQSAWHGSPHVFDKFSTDKIGTGEGAQVFGWGLYFAGKREIAEFYRNKLAPRGLLVGGVPVNDAGLSKFARDVAHAIAGGGMALDEWRSRMETNLARATERIAALPEDDSRRHYVQQDIDRANDTLGALDELDGKTIDYEPAKGRLFKVDVPDDSELMLWDAPLSEQPAGVREKLATLGFEGADLRAINAEIDRLVAEKETLAKDRDPRTNRMVRESEWLDLARRLDALQEQRRIAKMTGSGLYNALSARLSKSEGQADRASWQIDAGNKLASEALRAAGIPGHKYLDGSSRSAGDGTYNYVIYDDSRVQVEAMFSLRKNTQTPEFKKWFGDSKVVDADGDPLVVYRGQSAVDWDTGAPLETLQRRSEFPSFQVGEPGVNIAAFFTDDPAVANRFSGQFEPGPGSAPSTFPVYVSIQKPFEIDAKGAAAGTVQFGKAGQPFRDAVRSGDYDGVIIRNTKDEGNLFIPLQPTQIKSVNNRGTFDPADPRMMFELRRAPRDAAEAQQAMQGFITRGQPIDRALRLPFDILGGVDASGRWNPGKRLTDKIGKAGMTGASLSGVIGAGVGSLVAPGVGTAAGALVGGSVGAYLFGAKIEKNVRFGWLHGFAENARQGLIDRYGLSEEYLAADSRRAQNKRQIMTQAQDILQVLKNASVGTAEAKVLQAVLTGKDVTDADMTKIAVPIRKAIDDMGAEAVSLGLISAESFERNRGSYLHRVYLKNEADENGLAGWVAKRMAAKRKRIIGDGMKGRGMFWDIPVARLMRDVQSFKDATRGAPVVGDKFRVIDEVSETADMLADPKAKTLRRVYLPADEAVPARYTGPQWRDKGEWEVRKAGKTVTLWRDYTEAERTKMGEIVDARYTIARTFMVMANDLATGRFYKEIAENENWARAGAPETAWSEAADYRRSWNDPEIAWVKVPDTVISDTGGKKRWGALAGKFVRAEIWRDLNELDVATSPGAWRKLLTQWKINKTARSPVVHMNNIMSNLMFMDLADIRLQDLARGIRAFAKGNADYKEARDNGAFGSDMVSQEIRDNVLKPLLEEIAKQEQGTRSTFLAKAGALGKMADLIWTGVKKADRAMLSAYQIEDEIFRMATYLRRRQLGDSPAVAAQNAKEAFLDYDIRAPWVVAARNSVFPFISYTYRAVPKIAENLAHRPWKIAKYIAIAYAVNALGYLWDDGDDGEERERASLRDEEQGYTWLGVPRMLRMPYRDESGMPVFLDVRRWIPSGDIFDLEQGQSALPIPAPLQFGGPIQLAFEFLLNRQAFTGDDITNDLTDDNADKAEKVGDWLWKSWMPSAMWIPNSWYWTKMHNALSGATDPKGRDYGVKEALTSSIGIKLKPQDVESGIFWHNRDFQKVQQALRAELRDLGRKRERNLISQAEYDRGAARIADKFSRLREKVDEFNKQIEPAGAD